MEVILTIQIHIKFNVISAVQYNTNVWALT